jgi:pilus assembly protein Flp/PilA
VKPFGWRILGFGGKTHCFFVWHAYCFSSRSINGSAEGHKLFKHPGKPMLASLKNFWTEEEGATAVEYGIMVAAIAAVIITVVISIGGKVDTAFDTVDTAMPAGGV